MPTWTVTIPGPPVAKQAPRISVNQHTGRAHGRNAPKTANWLGYASAVVAAAWKGPPITGPIGLSIVAVFPRTKALTAKRLGGTCPAKRYVSTPIRHAVKPDLSNITKIVEDALTQACVWRDDARVSDYLEPFQKRYAAEGEAPHVRVEVVW